MTLDEKGEPQDGVLITRVWVLCEAGHIPVAWLSDRRLETPCKASVVPLLSHQLSQQMSAGLWPSV